MNDVVMLILCSTLGFVGFVYLIAEIIGNYNYCKKRRQQEKEDYINSLPKNLKM